MRDCHDPSCPQGQTAAAPRRPLATGVVLLMAGIVTCMALAAMLLATAAEPMVTIRNGVLENWIVTRDDETLLCEDPVVFIHARQIQCD